MPSQTTAALDRPPEALAGPCYSRGQTYLSGGNYELAQPEFAKERTLHPGDPGNKYTAMGRDCAARRSHDGECSSVPMDPNPVATHLIDAGLRQAANC